LIATFGLTIWQARWGYFFILVFAIALPALLGSLKSQLSVWIAFTLSIFPMLRDWDQQIWPNESVLAVRIEHRNESAQLRGMALLIRSSEIYPFLAPWWLSPEIAYWSGQPGVAGSSHEALDGIADSARFYLAPDFAEAKKVLDRRRVDWVFVYDSQRVELNSAAVLGISPIPGWTFCRLLDQAPSQAPAFLALAGQNPTAKLFRVVNKR
jgi:hypothetical protein